MKIIKYNMIQKMLFVGFYQIDRKQQTTFKQFYNYLTFVFKVLFILSFAFYINNEITRNGLQYANIPSRTIHAHQLWRLITAPFSTLQGLYGIISIVNAFWWLLSLFPGYERKYSSIHIAFEIFIQNLIYQIVYCICVLILLNFRYFQQTFNNYFYTLGWTPMIIIWVFKYTGENMQQTSQFCFLPFQIRNSYIPWIVTMTFVSLSMQKLPFFVASMLGWLQFHLLRNSFIRLSVKNHIFIERLFSFCLYKFASFIRVQQVGSQLNTLCGNKNYQNVTQNKRYNINFDQQIHLTQQIEQVQHKNMNNNDINNSQNADNNNQTSISKQNLI